MAGVDIGHVSQFIQCGDLVTKRMFWPKSWLLPEGPQHSGGEMELKGGCERLCWVSEGVPGGHGLTSDPLRAARDPTAWDLDSACCTNSSPGAASSHVTSVFATVRKKVCVMGWGAVEQAGRKKQSNSLTAPCTACVSLKCVSPTWKLLAALTSARKLFLKDVICLQLQSCLHLESVLLPCWMEFRCYLFKLFWF